MKAQVTEDGNFIQLTEYTKQEIDQIRFSFKRRIQNWRFHPLVKKKIWDGYIAFIDKYNRIPIGLWNELNVCCKKFEFELDIEGFDSIVDPELTPEIFEAWVWDFFKDHPKHCKGGPKEIRDYQISSVYNILKFKRSSSEIATSAGKTLMIFMMFAYLLDSKKASRYMIVVPNTSLIIQTMEDFEEYNNGKLKFTIQPIHGGTDKRKSDAACVIGTFQSLVKRDADWFDGVDVVCVDEAHYTNSASVKTVISKCKDLRYSFGLSGTLKKEEDSADHFTLQAYLGPFVNDVSAKFLIDNSYATKVAVKVIQMKYLEIELRQKLKDLRERRSEFEGSELLNIEKKVVIESRRRFNYVCGFVAKSTRNSLVLFSDIKYGYGRKVYDWLRNNTDKEVYYVDGGTAIHLRENYFEKMKNNDNIILVASFGTLSTGISINNIFNIFMLESYKSDRIIRQTIGRGMRLHAEKERVTIWDFVDDFTLGDENYLLKHGKERIRTYIAQGFPHKIYKVTF
ncbi:MAG: DEAD/DEAH box helicase family protein [Candidatus Pacearchaeota archaeon]|jgi:superfamily II DNA or RNA helicase|nr:DEAD/DEAH box helicase family protein [Clostridia bacterium]